MIFSDSIKCLDFLNSLKINSDFPTGCWKKAYLSHGWRIYASHVLIEELKIKYLENQTFETL